MPGPVDMPEPGGWIVRRWPVPPERREARRSVRDTLRRWLAAWSGLDPARLPLEETGRGPAWNGLLEGMTLEISLAYAGDSAWIALRRGGRIGIDAARIEPFAEMAAVAPLYLGPDAWTEIQAGPEPARAFARAWTAREARIKCLGLELAEWTPERARAEAKASLLVVDEQDGLAVTMALA